MNSSIIFISMNSFVCLIHEFIHLMNLMKNEFTLRAGKSITSSIIKMNSFIKWIHLILRCCYISILGTNIHKQELFVMAIRTPTGKTFQGNYTIIPSFKKWVLHSIFRMAFLSLYSEHLCSMNWLVLTNEEDAEYCAFECMIATHDAFCLSKVMLCTFHAVWQPLNGIYITCCIQRNLQQEILLN